MIETTDQTPKRTPTRVYRVNDTLIRAATQAAAVHHLVKRTIQYRVASQDDLIELQRLGLEIQEAGTPWKDQPHRERPTAAEMCNPLIRDAEERPGLRIEMVATATDGLKAHASALLGLGTAAETAGAAMDSLAQSDDVLGAGEDLEPVGTSDDPAVLGSGFPAVLATDETCTHHPV